MAGLNSIPKNKWLDSGNQVGLKADPIDWEQAILETFVITRAPSLAYVDAGSINVPIPSGAPAVAAMLNGFPNVLHPGQFIDAGALGTACDRVHRKNTSATTLTLATDLWGTEQASTWYAVLAYAAAGVTTFALKAMPFLRFSSQASQEITLRNNLNSADSTYGIATDALVGMVIYVLSGDSKGLLRAISANNGTTGTITYSGSALSMAAGDWFIVLPATNFKYLGSIFNNASSNIQSFVQDGDRVLWTTAPTSAAYTSNGVKEDIMFACPLAASAFLGVNTFVGDPDMAEATAAWVIVGHPSYYAALFQQVLFNQGVFDDVVYVADPPGVTTSFNYFTNYLGAPEIPIVNCKYYTSKTEGPGSTGRITSWTMQAAGYRYPAGYLNM